MTANIHPTHPDADLQKGATEDDGPHPRGVQPNTPTSLAGQQGHRDEHEELKDSDTDFPEPDASAEHSG